MSQIDCNSIVRKMRKNMFANESELIALKQAQNSNDLWEKCVLLREYTKPQQHKAEKLVREDLQISKPIDSISGDGQKNGVNYEIKVSVHAADCKLNIRQIRPHHNVDFYIIVFFNLLGGKQGEAFAFKVPSNDLYELVYQYGGYTHGTKAKNGSITRASIKDKSRDFEYSLSADPNSADSTKSKQVWKALSHFKVPYHPDSF